MDKEECILVLEMICKQINSKDWNTQSIVFRKSEFPVLIEALRLLKGSE